MRIVTTEIQTLVISNTTTNHYNFVEGAATKCTLKIWTEKLSTAKIYSLAYRSSWFLADNPRYHSEKNLNLR